MTSKNMEKCFTYDTYWFLSLSLIIIIITSKRRFNLFLTSDSSTKSSNLIERIELSRKTILSNLIKGLNLSIVPLLLAELLAEKGVEEAIVELELRLFICQGEKWRKKQ